MKKALLLCVMILVLFANSKLIANDWTIVQTYSIPGKASGLAWDGTFLYYGIYGANGANVYRFDPSTSTATLLFSNPAIGDSYGMTYDGQHLWIIDRASTGNAYAMQISLTGSILQQFTLPQQYMSGIAWDNGAFWAASYHPNPGWIYKLSSTGVVQSQIIPPMEQTWDLAMENEHLWLVDYNGNMIFKLNQQGTVLESHPSITQRPSGIVHDGQFLWYVAGPLSGLSTLYKVNPGGSGTPSVTVVPTNIQFGDVLTGQSHSKTFTVSNTGSGLLSFSFQQASQASNVVLPTGNFTLNPAQSNDFTATWTPTETGPMSAAAALISNDPLQPIITINFTGNAFTSTPYIVANPMSIDFESIRVQSTRFKRITLTNQGQETLSIQQISISEPGFYTQLPFLLPLNLAASGSASFDVWYYPQLAGTHQSNILIYSNATGQSPLVIPLSGQSITTELALGDVVWDVSLPPSSDNSPKAIHWIPDITGDTRPEVVIASEDNIIRCFNGNASGTGQVIWEREIYAGSLYQQQAIALGGDIDSDGIPDLVVGTAWGDRSVIAINSRTGEIMWKFQTNQFGQGGWVYQVDARNDFNGDGFPDVLAASGNDQFGTGPRRVLCLNGRTGQMIWNYAFTGPVFAVQSIADVTGDGVPEVFAAGSNNGESQGRVALINGANGTLIWDYLTSGSSVWAIAQLDDLNNDGKPELAAGTFNGNIYIFDAAGGAVLAHTSIGNNIITRLVRMDDVNGDGKADLAPGSSGFAATVLSGTNLEPLWSTTLPDKPWNIARIPDLNGDGINDLAVGLLYQNNFVYALDGQNGNILFSAPYGQAIDALTTVPDLTFDNSWEIVAGGRQGKVVVYAGGPVEITNIWAADNQNSTLSAQPNPFKDYTRIIAEISEGETLNLKIFSVAGEMVWNKMYSGVQGEKVEIIWDGTNNQGKRLDAGVYILQISGKNHRKSLKLFHVK